MTLRKRMSTITKPLTRIPLRKNNPAGHKHDPAELKSPCGKTLLTCAHVVISIYEYHHQIYISQWPVMPDPYFPKGVCL